MLVEIQHLGITVQNPLRTLWFYNAVLGFPFVSAHEVHGGEYDKIYELENPVNFIAWYQFPASAMELFHLPWHPPANVVPGDITKPGYCYAGYSVQRLDGFIKRLKAWRINFREARLGDARALLVRDPTGINVVLFEVSARGGSCVLGVEEAGLTVAGPAAYERYFNAIGLTPARNLDFFRDETAEGLLKDLFCISQPVEMSRYGHIRLLHFPGVERHDSPKFFPHDGLSSGRPFNDSGVRHVAYVVDNARDFHESASAKGVHFIFEPMLVSGGSLISYFHDPEGNTIEVIQPEPNSAKFMKFLGSARKEAADLFSRATLNR